MHRISKGSRYNQIYIPKDKEKFDVGDLVEVRLIEKNVNLNYSKNLRRLSNFKEGLIRDIFLLLRRFSNIKQSFIFGSFLTKKIEYRDIDVLVISKEDRKDFDEKVYSNLIKKFDLKFHIISITEAELDRLLRMCPMTRSMLYYSVSDKNFDRRRERELDENHIKFLLMMPEDLLEIKLKGEIFYNNIRRLITIESFLDGMDEDPKKVNLEAERLLGKEIAVFLRDNEEINDKLTKKIRTIIRNKLLKIRRLLNGKNWGHL